MSSEVGGMFIGGQSDVQVFLSFCLSLFRHSFFFFLSMFFLYIPKPLRFLEKVPSNFSITLSVTSAQSLRVVIIDRSYLRPLGEI